jgi:hypothetical protein
MAGELSSAPSGEKGDGNAQIQAQPVGASTSSSGTDPNLVSLNGSTKKNSLPI